MAWCIFVKYIYDYELKKTRVGRKTSYVLKFFIFVTSFLQL